MSPSAPGTVRELGRLAAAAWRSGRGRCLRAVALAVLPGAAELAGFSLLVPLLAVAGVGGDAGGASAIGDGAAAALGALGLPATLPVLLGAFVLLASGGALLDRARGVAEARLGAAVARDLRRRLHGALVRSSWPWFSRLRASDAAHALTEEAERAASAAQGLVAAAAFGAAALGTAALAAVAAPGPVLLAAAAGFAAILAGARVSAARARGAAISAADRGLHASLGEGMQEARTERAEGRVGEGAGRFRAAASGAARARVAAYRGLAGSRALAAVGTAAVLALFVYASVAWFRTAPAALLLSLFLLNRLLHRGLALARQAEHVAADLPGFTGVDRLLRAAAAAGEGRHRPGAPLPLREGIRVRGVSFSYGGPDRPAAVRDADLEIPAGSLVVLSGPSGSGKTTLADLVAGVLRPDRGSVLVDGKPLEGERLAAWGRSVGYVAEDALLLHGTVRSNLLRGAPGATEPELWCALALAGAEGFVRALPGGLDAGVGERGLALSGGQRVRVALARALLRRPALLVLDGVADRLGPAAVSALSGTATILSVTGRGGESPVAERVFHLAEGRVLAAGSREEAA